MKKSDNFSVYKNNFIKICSDAQRFFQNPKSTFGFETGKTKENGDFSILLLSFEETKKKKKRVKAYSPHKHFQ